MSDPTEGGRVFDVGEEDARDLMRMAAAATVEAVKAEFIRLNTELLVAQAKTAEAAAERDDARSWANHMREELRGTCASEGLDEDMSAYKFPWEDE